MGHKGMIRTAILLIAAASFLALGVRAQSEPSVADAARRSRQQKQASAKPSSVITNDTLRPAPTTEASTEAAERPQRNASETEEEGEQKKRDIAKLKEEIAQKQQQLKFLKSDLALKQDTFYSNPEHQHDADGKTKLDSVKSDIKQAEDELAALQAKLAGLGPAAEAEPAPPSER